MSADLEKLREEMKGRGRIPRHVAIIMDGNGRWAKARGLSRIEGHEEGINSVRDAVEACGELGIEVLTLYTFSTENWQRPKSEVSALMRLLVRTIRNEVNELDKNNVRFKTIGNLDDLPLATKTAVKDIIARLSKNNGLTLNLALSYSGRLEIIDAVKAIAARAVKGEMSLEEIDEKVFSRHLQTNGIPDPDLIIRTSGEMRLSNFLLWQLAYSEIIVCDTYWPDFRKEEFYRAIEMYQHRERRFGKVSEQLK